MHVHLYVCCNTNMKWSIKLITLKYPTNILLVFLYFVVPLFFLVLHFYLKISSQVEFKMIWLRLNLKCSSQGGVKIILDRTMLQIL